jgi:formylmethanofuran dehydrogenase subunit E
MKNRKFDLDKGLKEAEKFHGHLCAGMMLGTRMAIMGMEAIGINDPKGKDRKNLIVYVETDRCATDAILVLTGCQPGKRTMKIMDYGKMAATFLNLKTGKAVRIAAKNTDGDKVFTRDMIEKNPHAVDYAKRPKEELFTLTEVKVDVRPEDMPGPPLRTVPCSICGERVMDMKDVEVDGKYLCRPCAENRTYYRSVEK